MSTMSLRTLSLRALLLLGLWHTGRRSLASAPELQSQPKKIGKPDPRPDRDTHCLKHLSYRVGSVDSVRPCCNVTTALTKVCAWKKTHNIRASDDPENTVRTMSKHPWTVYELSEYLISRKNSFNYCQVLKKSASQIQQGLFFSI